MNTIKNYLESMFANMPNTAEVLKAKNELWQMMEDKYNELIADGKTENEAVGTVIAEFGNLEELVDDLGLKKEYEQEQQTVNEMPRRKVSYEEATQYIKDKTKQALLIGIGVILCIMCPCGPILGDGFKYGTPIGILTMFSMIAIAVVLFVLAGSNMKKWDFLKEQACAIDYGTAIELSKQKETYATNNAIRLTIGILLCAFSWVPSAILDEMNLNVTDFSDNVLGTIFFFMVAIGVFLIVYTTGITNGYDFILKVNGHDTVSGTYTKEGKVVYINNTVATIMELYWPTITCLYLIVSFLTFRWFSTWIIWPIAAIVHSVLKKNLSK